MTTTLLVTTAVLGTSAGFGGVAGTKVFVDVATAQSNSHFDAYFPELAGSGTDEERNKRDAFRHAYVNGAMKMVTSDTYAHFLGDLNEVMNGQVFLLPELSNMDLWNNEVGRSLADNATDTDDLAAMVAQAIETGVTINDPYDSNDTRTYSGQKLEITPEALAQLQEAGGENILSPALDPASPPKTDLGVPIPSRKPDACPLPSWMDDGVLPSWEDGIISGSPLVLDIDDDGIELTELGASGSVYWDIDQDGFAESTGWVTGGDGLLAIDLNSDGFINDNGELFGNQSGSPNGFSTLASYDTNADGHISSADAQYSDLLIWIDDNANGVSESTELHTLTELSITSIDLGYSSVSYQLAGNDVLQQSTFIMNGSTRDIVDAWFTYDDVNTKSLVDYTLDIRTLFMPNLRGYGQVHDLHIAMSLDSNLYDNIEDIATTDLAILLSPAFDLNNKITDIIYRWAGVHAVNPTETTYLDARKLAFLERLVAQEFTAQADPGTLASAAMERAFYEAQNAVLSRLLLQSRTADEIFLSSGVYDLATDDFIGSFTLDFSSLESFVLGLGLSGGDLAEAWTQILRLIDGTVEINKMAQTDINQLETIVSNTDAALSVEHLLNAVFPTGGNIYDELFATDDEITGSIGGDSLFGGDGNDILWGDFGGDILYGGNQADALHGGYGDDELFGGSGNDTLFGGYGDDNLQGGDGDDILDGGRGNDYSAGGLGNDTYIFNVGDGHSYIYESDGAGYNIVTLGEGFLPENVYIVSMRAYGSIWLISGDDESDAIEIRGGSFSSSTGFDLSATIDEIHFDNSSVWNLSGGLLINDNNFAHTLDGTGFSDTISGNGGADTLYGHAGDDIMDGGSGNDVLYGGVGDDMLDGGTGADSLYGGDGNDTLISSVPSEYDYLYGGAGADTFVSLDSGGSLSFVWAHDFSVLDGDVIDLSDILTLYDPLTHALTDFVDITQTGGHTQIKVDRDGTDTGYDWQSAAQLQYFTSISTDEATLVSNGTLLVA